VASYLFRVDTASDRSFTLSSVIKPGLVYRRMALRRDKGVTSYIGEPRLGVDETLNNLIIPSLPSPLLLSRPRTWLHLECETVDRLPFPFLLFSLFYVFLRAKGLSSWALVE
jgi:hypothetical protein